MLTRLLYLIACLLWLVLPSECFAGQFLWLSDLHFDPFADRALVDPLAAAEPSQWAAILANGSGKFPAFGQDASWPLLAATLEAAHKALPDAAFTIVTGDLLAHHFREQFNAAAAVHDDEAFRTFVHKTMEFVGLQLKQLSPGSRVIVSLGNNDDICGDYLLQPDGPFLHDTARLMAELAGVADVGSFSVNGSYSLAHPTVPNHRIIVLNTVFFSPRYRNGCGQNSGDPGEEVLNWLAIQLAAAQLHHEKVWIVCHIPPGLDAFATTHPKEPAAAGSITLLWKDLYARKFLSLMDQYRSAVGPIFAGHIHLDDFRLLGPSKKSAFIVLAPAISPNIGQNPGFRVVTYNAQGRLTDQSTYYLNNLALAGGKVAPSWVVEYNFRKEWHLSELNAANYTKLYREMALSPQMNSRWKTFYSVSRAEQSAITPINAHQFYCAIGNISVADYQSCVAAKP